MGRFLAPGRPGKRAREAGSGWGQNLFRRNVLESKTWLDSSHVLQSERSGEILEFRVFRRSPFCLISGANRGT